MAQDCGFELAGITTALPSADFWRYESWRASGYAGEMGYLTDRRGDLRADPRNLLPAAKSILCVGKLYNCGPSSVISPEQGKIARYVAAEDYHNVLRAGLEDIVQRLQLAGEDFSWRICVDTAPLLERSYARQAGLGWIGRNTCLINEQQGSWFLLAELLLSLELEPDTPPPDRCGTCRRCLDACPTDALLMKQDGTSELDSQLCLSYLTIEKRGEVPRETANATGPHLFGCDICQEVCPWNRRAPVTDDPLWLEFERAVPLAELAELTGEEFRRRFRNTAVYRSKYSGFLRNVAVAMGNSKNTAMQEPLRRLTNHSDWVVASTAMASLSRLESEVDHFPDVH